MPILATALFGSRARGDETPSSDTDLLMVTANEPARHTGIGNLSLSFYSIGDLEDRARTGDLFLCHILREGRPLYDPDNCFRALRSAFRLRSSYQREIGLAADLGWLIVHFADTLRRSPLIGRRVTWSIRSILIARSAEAGNPIFSATELGVLAPLPETRRLIAQKDMGDLGSTTRDDLRRFLTWCDLPDPLPNAREPTDFMKRFEATENAVALHFLASVENGRDFAGYS